MTVSEDSLMIDSVVVVVTMAIDDVGTIGIGVVKNGVEVLSIKS